MGGYNEILCTICGASFNIARVRRQDEPKSAAWNCYGAPDSYVHADEFYYCDKESGCTYYSRELDDGIYRSPWQKAEDTNNDSFSNKDTAFEVDEVARGKLAPALCRNSS